MKLFGSEGYKKWWKAARDMSTFIDWAGFSYDKYVNADMDFAEQEIKNYKNNKDDCKTFTNNNNAGE